jgi:hypothetical protein
MKRELTALLSVDEGTLDITSGDSATLARDLIAQVRSQLDTVDDNELERRLTRLLFTSRHHSLRGQLGRVLQAGEVTDSDKLVTRIEWVRFDDPDGVRLILPDRELNFSARLAPALDVVLSAEPFRVGDLSPHLDEEERVAFAARLIREGLLELR